MSFAALRAKAEAAANTAKDKSNAFIDKRQSPSSSRPAPPRAPSSSGLSEPAERRLPPSSAASPPKPPARRIDSSSAAQTPLPPPRSAAPDLPSRSAAPSRPPVPSQPARESPPPVYAAVQARVFGDGPQEKQAFFSLLDEYFANKGQHRVLNTQRAPLAPTTHETVAHVEPDQPAAPTWARPPPSAGPPLSADDFTMSHPPESVRSCSAEDACTDFTPDAVWQTAWYTSPAPQPPLMQQRNDLAWSGSMMQRGSEKSVIGMALFADLSQCWYRVSFFVGQAHPSEVMSREARFAPRPPALDQANCEWASEVYGETIAQFAEDANRSRRSVGDGECWTLAAEAIKSIDPSLPKPVPSISRTHGSLIYEGKATGEGRQVGRWRGGDSQVRRGDIVEWRRVTINEVNAPRGSWSTLGNPDHTAVIVSDAVPSRSPGDGESLLPSELDSLEVIEQSAGKVCERRRYDLAAFSVGEMWIYRPCSMDQLGLGALAAVWPPPVTAYEA